jgi:AhpD family alkylhydroperoxidase
MARISYPDPSAYADEPLARRIAQERGGVLNLYRMLLHSPPIAEGWLAFLTAVRQRGSLPGRYRELAILRVAVLNGASYEFDVHTPFALREGIAPAAVEALRADPMTAAEELEASDRAVLAYTDAMTRAIRVPAQVFENLREHLDERHIVELTATVAAYNCVSRFLEALQIDHD